MTDREWPEYPNQSGGETVTGPESAQEEAASERRIRRPPLQRSANRKRVQIGSGPPRRQRKKSPAVSAGKIWERWARRRSSRRPRLSSRRKAQSLPKPQKHRAGSPEWNPQRIAERNRICPPNLRNRPARSSKRLRLSLRRKLRCRFKRKTHGSLEPSARRILTAGKARSRWQSGRLPNRMIRARRFPGRLPRRLRLCGIPAGRRLTVRRRRIIPMGKANIREAGIPSSGRSRRLTMEGRLIRRLTPIRIKLPMVIPARRPGIKGSLVTRKAAGIPSSQPSRRGPALCLRLLSLPKRRLESFQMPSRRRKRG